MHSQMRGIKRIYDGDLNRLFLPIGIIAALCFSAGEGLRLTPFPADSVARINLPEGKVNTNASCETSPTKYGPIYLPKPTQARSKQKVFHIDCLPAPLAVNHSPHFCPLLDVSDASKVASLQLISRTRDRAPPLSLTS